MAFFYLEGRTTPQHVGGIAIFEAPDGIDYERLVALLEERISLVPRYRQRMRTVPGNVGAPVWVDDPSFDITYHVRRSMLPRPGTDAALLEFAGRIMPRLLDRARPLWEMYLVEGLSEGRVAIVTKTHHSMVDGVGAIDIAQVLLDASPEPRGCVESVWMPEPEPSAVRLVLDALIGDVRRPLDAAGHAVQDARATAASAGHAVSTACSMVTGAVRPARRSALRVRLGEQRRIAVARTSLGAYRAVRAQFGGTVHDVALATVAGALRRWLIGRGDAPAPGAVVRALVPLSLAGDGSDAFATGGERSARVVGVVVPLPVGEADPVRRLVLLQQELAARTIPGRAVGADALVAMSGFAPPTLHALGARAASRLTRRTYDLVVTNVPGPQHALYAASARMTEMFPVLPLAADQALSIGMTSYDGGVYFGVHGDRDAVADIDALAHALTDELDELVALAGSVVAAEPRSRG